MPDMTVIELIGGILHDVTRASCHLEDLDRDLYATVRDLDELTRTLPSVRAVGLAPFSQGLEDQLIELNQLKRATHETLMSLAETLQEVAEQDGDDDGLSPGRN